MFEIKRIGGFHVTQVSLFNTQVKNKIAYRLINWVKKLKYRRGIINKQRAKDLGMCDIPNSSYSAKGITENYSVWYGDAMFLSSCLSQNVHFLC